MELIQQFVHNLEVDSVQAEYIWLGGNNGDLRSKSKTLKKVPKSVADLPLWNYDGSSTNQGTTTSSEITLVPRAMFKDPFRKGHHLLVLCDTYDQEGNPLTSNTRANALKIFEQAIDEEPWFGIEQEYVLLTSDGLPLGWPKDGLPEPQGPYYCGVGAGNIHGRYFVEAHYKCCLYAGISVSGINAEVMPGQWEFQVGPCTGIDAGDQLWVARYIMYRLGEMFNLRISFAPKPMQGNWNGSGAHTNFSTKRMRMQGGISHIMDAIKRLGHKHNEHMVVYGDGNEQRLTGLHETSAMNKFSYGIGNRGASIRVGNDTVKAGCGYLEDRRPAANMDPYVVTSKIFETAVLTKSSTSP